MICEVFAYLKKEDKYENDVADFLTDIELISGDSVEKCKQAFILRHSAILSAQDEGLVEVVARPFCGS